MSPPLPADAVGTEVILLAPRRMGRYQRLGMLLAAVAMATVLGLARWIEPDQRGYGTHEQLGLPPCSFRVITGVPCPSCGMTTSFAYVVRGRLVDAASTNPGGCLLAMGIMGLAPWCVASAVVGRTLWVRSPDRAALTAMLVVFGISIVGWIVRFLLHGRQG